MIRALAATIKAEEKVDLLNMSAVIPQVMIGWRCIKGWYFLSSMLERLVLSRIHIWGFRWGLGQGCAYDNVDML